MTRTVWKHTALKSNDIHDGTLHFLGMYPQSRYGIDKGKLPLMRLHDALRDTNVQNKSPIRSYFDSFASNDVSPDCCAIDNTRNLLDALVVAVKDKNHQQIINFFFCNRLSANYALSESFIFNIKDQDAPNTTSITNNFALFQVIPFVLNSTIKSLWSWQTCYMT